MEFSSDFGPKSSVRLSTKDAWAHYARRRWPTNGVKSAMVEWSLTEGEAKGLFGAQISQPTIDKIIEHPRGGFALGLTILQIKTRTALTDFIATEKARHAAARQEIEDQERRLGEMAADLPALLRVGSGRLRGVDNRRRGEGRSLGG